MLLLLLMLLFGFGYFDQVTPTTKMKRIRKRSASTSTRAGAAAASVLLASGVALLVLDESSLFSGKLSSPKRGKIQSSRSLLGSAVTGNQHDHTGPSTTGPASTQNARVLSTDERLLQMTAEDASGYSSIWSSEGSVSAGDRRGLRTLLEEELNAVMTEENAGSEIWLINQPKCGTSRYRLVAWCRRFHV